MPPRRSLSPAPRSEPRTKPDHHKDRSYPRRRQRSRRHSDSDSYDSSPDSYSDFSSDFSSYSRSYTRSISRSISPARRPRRRTRSPSPSFSSYELRSRSPPRHRHRDRGRRYRSDPVTRSRSTSRSIPSPREYSRRQRTRGSPYSPRRRYSPLPVWRRNTRRRYQRDTRRPDPPPRESAQATKHRDLRTVFVSRLAQRVREKDLFQFFSAAGKVRDVRLVMDRVTARHKSAGYVEFFDRQAVAAAVALNEKILCGYPVAVKPTVDERTLQEEPSSNAAHALDSTAPTARIADAAVETSVGWSMATRHPIRSNAARRAEADYGNSNAFPTSAPTKLVSIPELVRLLNPNNLPLPPKSDSSIVPDRAVTAPEAASSMGFTPVPLPSSAVQPPVSSANAASSFTRLYIGSVPFHLTEIDLQAIFGPLGDIVSLQLQREAGTARSKGYGFVEFANHESAKEALKLDGYVIADRTLKVALASQEQKPNAVAGRLSDMNSASVVPLPGPVGHSGVAHANSADVVGELDEGRDGGLAMNASQRALLMQQLSRGESIGNKPNNSENRLPVSSLPSKSLILCNMFDPRVESPGFERELAEDVRDECASKYGSVVHLHVDTKSQGTVYIRFASADSALKAKGALHGRWFGGNKIQASFTADKDYSHRFPGAPE